MPLLPCPAYRPIFPFTSGHLQTVFPTLCRWRPGLQPERERLELPDGDFLDIDWHLAGRASDRLAVISHGLEGHARKSYPLGMAAVLTATGWDVICLNFRGCSGEPNRTLRFYHSGVTDDLHTVLGHGLARGPYRSAALLGFSMGGNQTLKYLGEDPGRVPPEVRGAIAFSVPCDLAGSARVLARPVNAIYMRYFLGSLRRKVREKASRFPGSIKVRGLESIRTFMEFDDRYTAPIHGFASAMDYYQRCSAHRFVAAIRVPTLLVQAADDPFLSPSCYPLHLAEQSAALHLEVPTHGGHVGFVANLPSGPYWSELRALRFLEQQEPGFQNS